MEKRGWRAIIYDCEWAFFKENQSGLTISNDGKECETWDDNIDLVDVILEKNESYDDKGGHILFSQKGSDLHKIVNINQGGNQTYELRVSTNYNKFNGCPGDCDDRYGYFLDGITIEERKNSSREEDWIKIDNTNKNYYLTRPKKDDICNGWLDNLGNQDVPETVAVENTCYDFTPPIHAEASVDITIASSNENEVYYDTEISNDNAVKAEFIPSPTPTCSIGIYGGGEPECSCEGAEVQFIALSDATCEIGIENGEEASCSCTGKTVQFSGKTTIIESSIEYNITGLNQVIVTHIYNIIKCEETIGEKTEPGQISSWDLAGEQEGGLLIEEYCFRPPEDTCRESGNANSRYLWIKLNKNSTANKINIIASANTPDGEVKTKMLTIDLPNPNQ